MQDHYGRNLDRLIVYLHARGGDQGPQTTLSSLDQLGCLRRFQTAFGGNESSVMFHLLVSCSILVSTRTNARP
jgi:hypothetical protein